MKTRIKNVKNKKEIVVRKLAYRGMLTLDKAFVHKLKLKKRNILQYLAIKYSFENRNSLLKKMMLIEFDFTLPKNPIVPAKKFSMSQFSHFANSIEFLPKVIHFLCIYPFSAAIIGKIFNMNLNVFKFFKINYDDTYNFLSLVKKIVIKEFSRNMLQSRKENHIKILLRDILSKNIMNRVKKNKLGEEKYINLLGSRYKIMQYKSLKWKRYLRLKTKILKYIIKKLSKNNIIKKIKKYKKSHNLIKIFIVLNNLIKTHSHLNNERKNLSDEIFTKNSLDFFYNKHNTEIKNYCFK